MKNKKQNPAKLLCLVSRAQNVKSVVKSVLEPQSNTSKYEFLINYILFSINLIKTDIVQCCSVKASLVSLHQIHQTGLWNTSTLIKRVFPYQPILHLLSTLKLAYEWNARFWRFLSCAILEEKKKQWWFLRITTSRENGLKTC